MQEGTGRNGRFRVSAKQRLMIARRKTSREEKRERGKEKRCSRTRTRTRTRTLHPETAISTLLCSAASASASQRAEAYADRPVRATLRRPHRRRRSAEAEDARTTRAAATLPSSPSLTLDRTASAARQIVQVPKFTRTRSIRIQPQNIRNCIRIICRTRHMRIFFSTKSSHKFVRAGTVTVKARTVLESRELLQHKEFSFTNA